MCWLEQEGILSRMNLTFRVIIFFEDTLTDRNCVFDMLIARFYCTPIVAILIWLYTSTLSNYYVNIQLQSCTLYYSGSFDLRLLWDETSF